MVTMIIIMLIFTGMSCFMTYLFIISDDENKAIFTTEIINPAKEIIKIISNTELAKASKPAIIVGSICMVIINTVIQ